MNRHQDSFVLMSRMKGKGDKQTQETMTRTREGGRFEV